MAAFERALVGRTPSLSKISAQRASPCIAALDELTRNYGVSVVICTATQPAIAAPDFVRGLALGPERDLAPEPHRLHRSLTRVKVVDAGEVDDERLLDDLGGVEQGLVIVNSRAHALDLFQAAQQRAGWQASPISRRGNAPPTAAQFSYGCGSILWTRRLAA
jgi:hypothetical protein